MKIRSWLWLLPLTFFVSLFFALSTHPFEVPDEQSHYATVHYLASEGAMPELAKHADLSLEEEKTEYLFGIMSEGNNRYSYHPEFRIEYIPGLVGLHEAEIKSYNTPALRRTYTIHQAAIYPPLYYLLVLPLYRLVESSDILARLFALRFGSVAITAVTVLAAYFMGLILFGKRSYGLTLALMTLFFPMTVYVGTGVTSDNLHNLLFTIFLCFAFKYLKSGWTTRESLFAGLVIGLDILTKPQAYVMFPLLALAVIIRGNWGGWRIICTNLLLVAFSVIAVAGWYRQPQYLDTGSNFIAAVAPFGGLNHFQVFIKEYLSLFTGAMLVWYWGVFKWFGVVLPRPIWWVANRLIIVAGLGLLLSFWRAWKKQTFSFMTRAVLFALLANLTYLGALLWFDWQFYQQIGRSLGLQARYLMPLLTTQMFLLLYGLTRLSLSAKFQEAMRRGVIIFFLILHLSGLYTMLGSYYDLWPLSRLIEQMSQYKPAYAKGAWWYLWFPLYFAGIISLVRMTIQSDKTKK